MRKTLDALEQFAHLHAESARDPYKRGDRRVRFAGLDSLKVLGIQMRESGCTFLGQISLQPESSNAAAEASKDGKHGWGGPRL